MKKWSKAFKSFQILVPASISNLGCGFDTLGLAVSLYLKVAVHSAPDFKIEIRYNGKDLSIPEDENLFLHVLRSCYPVSPDEWNFHIAVDTEIPLKRGLGSSACAVIAGLLTAARLLNLKQETVQIVQTSLRWEPHSDNICASTLGGLTVAMNANGTVHYQKHPFPKSLRIMLVIPDWEIATELARKALPSEYSREAVVSNLQRLAFFMGLMRTENFRALRESVFDQIHQPYRALMMPFAQDLLDKNNFASDCAVVISGSGSTFAVLYKVNEKKIRSIVQEIMSIHHIAYDLRSVMVDEEGARIESLED